MLMDDIKPNLNTIEERIRHKIQNQIKYCDYDQPYDGGDVVWIYGDKTDLYDMFADFELPEKSQDKIIAHLSCPSCGNSSFELASNIGLETLYEREINSHVSKAGKVFKNEIKDFEDFIQEYPLLASQHKVGRKILKEIDKKTLPVVKIKGTFFRARGAESSKIVDSNEMFAAPKGKSFEGRFNHSGQSHLYLASSKNTAISEIVQQKPSMLVWYQKFKLEKEVNNILDLTFDWSNLETSTSIMLISLHYDNSLSRSERNLENWRPDYFLTRYIMDCAKKCGYNGIKYNSAVDSIGYNVVLYDPDISTIKPIGNPAIKIFMYKDERDNFRSDFLDF